MAAPLIIAVTGANRGIGFEVTKQLVQKGFSVLLCARNSEQAAQAAEQIRSKFPNNSGLVKSHQLDVANQHSIERFSDFVVKEFGKLDVLINNAGIYKEKWDQNIFNETFQTNLYGPIHMNEAFLPLLKKRGEGKIINVSSSLGQLNKLSPSYRDEVSEIYKQGVFKVGQFHEDSVMSTIQTPTYNLSKAYLNAYTYLLGQELKSSYPKIEIHAVCPGWVRTDMGGPNAHLSVEEGADTIVWLATDPEPKETGTFWYQRKPISREGSESRSSI